MNQKSVHVGIFVRNPKTLPQQVLQIIVCDVCPSMAPITEVDDSIVVPEDNSDDIEEPATAEKRSSLRSNQQSISLKSM